MPCVTAFSTSGCSSSGGTRQAPASAPASIARRSRSPKRTRSISRKRAARLSSRAERDPRLRRRARGSRAGSRPAARTCAARRPRRDGQRADRVQAVEQEVRIDLGAQRPQLRLAREHLHLERTPLDLARLLERPHQVTDRERQQVEQHAEGRKQRRRCLAPRPQRRARRRGFASNSIQSARRQPATSRCSAGSGSAVASGGPGRSRASGMLRDTYHADRHRNP